MSVAFAQPAPRLAALDDPQEQGLFTRWLQAADGERVAVSQFQLSGLTCAACAGIIEDALLKVPGVQDARVSAASEHAEVRWNPRQTRPSVLVEAIEQAGYRAVPDAAAPARLLRQAEHRLALWRLFVAGFCMMQVMMVAVPVYFAAPGEIAPDLLKLLNWAGWLLSLPVLLFSARPFFQSAWQRLRQRRIGMDVPVSLGILVTFVASSAATFEPGGLFGHEVYFDSLTMFVFFLLGGRTLELRARHRVADSLERALSRLPESVQRVDADGQVSVVGVRQLRAGDRVRVLAGQAFPADGVLLDGQTEADEALLTGESRPLVKQAGDALVAGSLNLLAPVLMRVERIGADTRYEGIVALMRSALMQRPAGVRLTDRLAGPFLWAVLALAALAAAAWSVIDPSRAVWVAVSVLIVTCPCAISLAAPSALLAATGTLARRGVLLQRLEALEALAKADTLFVDKTGTLTEDRLELHATRLLPAALLAGVSEAALQAQAAALAALSAHPMAGALAETFGAALPGAVPWREVAEHAGSGLQARAGDGRVFRLGSRRWVEAGVRQSDRAGAGDASDGAALWFGPVGEAWAAFDLAEKLRPDTAAALDRLRASGLDVVLLSGDRPDQVQALAERVGIDDVRGGATPEAKLAAVAQAQAAGRVVAMVGDGLNDAPVLARADVSFAFAHGAAVTQSHADAIVLGSRIGDVADAFALARRTVRVVRQNLAWAALYNAACIPLALVGWLPPWAAGLGMAGSSVLVVLNSLRLAQAPPAG
ncbi:MAG: cation-translocating P-type ATPase [Rhizobacter sp.]|nr:cation-translocating P-type ATPase [Rhizobacter sp.]